MPLDTFSDLVHMTEEETQSLLRRTEYQVVERALYDDDDEAAPVREKLFATMSERVRNFIQEDLDTLNFSRKQVEEARQHLLKIAQSV